MHIWQNLPLHHVLSAHQLSAPRTVMLYIARRCLQVSLFCYLDFLSVDLDGFDHEVDSYRGALAGGEQTLGKGTVSDQC